MTGDAPRCPDHGPMRLAFAACHWSCGGCNLSVTDEQLANPVMTRQPHTAALRDFIRNATWTAT